MLTRDTLLRLSRARDLLREVHEAPLPIDAVARRVGMSPSQLFRGFKSVFGEAPHQWRIRDRIERAKHLLVAEGRSVTDTCMGLGFASVGSFSALFRRRVGVSPSSYQRTFRPYVVAPGRMPDVLAPGCFALHAAACARE